MEKRRRSRSRSDGVGLSFGCSALHGKDNAISDVERGDDAFVPFIFPWFQYLQTNRNNLLTIRNIAKDNIGVPSKLHVAHTHTRTATELFTYEVLLYSSLYLFEYYCVFI